MRKFFLAFIFLFISSTAFSEKHAPVSVQKHKLWYDEPAADRGGDIPVGESDRPIDIDWEQWSLPIGNGYMGACIFGGTNAERIQLTDKTLYIKGLWKSETHTSFCDLFLDFYHTNHTNYRRSLTLDNGIAEVSYEYQGVKYHREYFMSYPDNVLVIKLTADKPRSLSFSVRPQIPHLTPFGPLQRRDSITIGYLSGSTQSRFSYNGREGKVFAHDDMITLRGTTEYFKLIYEAQLKVIPVNGTIHAQNDSDSDHGILTIENADSAVILLTLGTNYEMKPQVFFNKAAEKLKGFPDPHEQVVKRLEKAVGKGYDKLRNDHIGDFSALFNRVQLHLAEKVDMTTDDLLKEYKQGNRHLYLEELFFHYGRYLLISSARKGALPPTLQGVWNQYELAPWNGNYTHNINIQMNYWPAFNTNLIELFESYADYHKAYKPMAEKYASSFVNLYHPESYSSEKSGNGWTMGIGSSAYNVSMPSGHSGSGVSAFTSKLFWEYYAFTGDDHILRETVYPAVSGVANFLSKAVKDTLGYLLASPSASPEQYSKLTRKPYPTIGCAFDQQMIYENHNDAIKATALLKRKDKNRTFFKKQQERLDPVQIGASGQIKEYREEKFYGDIVLEQNHRHISHLVGLYPGTLINENTPAWLDAAKVTLNRRGDISTGWSMAHKLNLWARTKEGERAHDLLTALLTNATFDNLWTNCIAVLRAPYQIDANLGATAGIAEMLLQSHEGYIDLLPALPGKWNTGYYKGLTARGNFEVSADWREGNLIQAEILSGHGNRCILKYPDIERAVVKDEQGRKVGYQIEGKGKISFKTSKDMLYTITQIPTRTVVTPPRNLEAVYSTPDCISLNWQSDVNVGSYRIYRTRGNNPDYELIASDIKDKTFHYVADDICDLDYLVFKVVRVDPNGNYSKGTTTCVLKENK